MVTFQEADNVAINLRDLEVVARARTSIQKIAIYRHAILGRVLVLDGELHHVEAWQAHYHEPLVHLPASFIPQLKTALVLGGGCLFAAREVLKYSTVESVELIEHDPAVVELMHRHYPHAEKVLSDRRFNLRIGDARQAYSEREKRYDLIVCDCFDISTDNRRLRSSAYARLQALLTPNGVCSDVLYRHVLDQPALRRSLKGLAQCDRLTLSLIAVPEYPGVLHLHAMWGFNPFLSQTPGPIKNAVQASSLKRGSRMKFEFYDPRHRGYFLYLPPYLRHALPRSMR